MPRAHASTHGRESARWSRRSFHVLQRALVLQADLVDQLRLDDQAFLDRHRERLRVGLRIVDGQLNLHVPEVWTTDLFAYLRGLADDAALPIDPAVISQTDRVDDQR